MSRTLRILTTILLVILAFAILGGLTWANTLYAHDHPGEKDFFVPWLAARTFLQYGNSPYSDPATQRAQVVYYGALADEGQDPLRLGIPFPVELFYFPFALVTDYALARGIWMTCLEIALVALAFLSLCLTGWKPARTLMPVLLIFSVLWVYGFLPLAGSRAVIFAALAVVGLLLALRDGWGFIGCTFLQTGCILPSGGFHYLVGYLPPPWSHPGRFPDDPCNTAGFLVFYFTGLVHAFHRRIDFPFQVQPRLYLQ